MEIRRRAGFTLLELLVVLMLLAVTAAAAVPAFLGDATRTPEQRVAMALAEQLIAAREAARESGSSATMTLSPADGRYWVATRDSTITGSVSLADGISLQSSEGRRIEIRFAASGKSSPATLTVHGSRNITITIDAWNGDIALRDARAK